MGRIFGVRGFAAMAASVSALAAFSGVARADIDVQIQMRLGNPDRASSDASSREKFLIRRPQYALSYNDRLRFPNWVAWHLSARDIGTVERGQFMAETLFPDTFTRIFTSEYTRTGYDRGHNCPSKDRSASRIDNDAVFFMSNITPQMHGMNAGPWEGFESYCRSLTSAGNEVYIVCGHGFSDSKFKTIGRAGIAVPDFAWKIALVLPEKSGNDLSRISETTRVIAVRMPNISTIANKDWREFRVSVDEIEKATGLNFFDALPPKIAAALKSKVDFDRSAPSKATRPIAGNGPGADPQTNPPTGNGGAGNNGGVAGDPATAGQVWVNLNSGVYWKPGSQFYGKTKRGKYMTEPDAIKAGYRAAR